VIVSIISIIRHLLSDEVKPSVY